MARPGTYTKRPRPRYFKVLENLEWHGRRMVRGRVIQLRKTTADKWLAQGKIVEVPKARFTDVLRAGLRLPERVVILGSGPRGIDHYDQIPADRFVIALNRAHEASVRHHIWAAMDPRLPADDWFKADLFDIKRAGYDCSIGAIGGPNPVPVMRRREIARLFPWIRCTFELRRVDMMNPRNVKPLPDRLRPGATVAGAMTQLCFHCGVKRIDYCGIDFFGGVYFDGSKHRNERKRRDKTWSAVKVFNSLFRHLELEGGMILRTLSETKLDLEMAEPEN